MKEKKGGGAQNKIKSQNYFRVEGAIIFIVIYIYILHPT